MNQLREFYHAVKPKVSAKLIKRTDTCAMYELSDGMIEIFLIQHNDAGNERYATNNDFMKGVAWNYRKGWDDKINARWELITSGKLP